MEKLFELHRERAAKIRDECGYKNGPDPRRRLERRDFELIHEDPREMANLPRKAIHHEFPEDRGFVTPFIFSL